MKIIFTLLLLVYTLRIGAEPMPFSLSANDTPCLYAENDNTYYATVVMPEQGELEVTLTCEGLEGNDVTLLSLDEQPIKPSVSLVSWNEGKHCLAVLINGNLRNYQLIFTSLPVVKMDIDPDSPISKEISAHAFITITDALSRVDGKNIYTTDAEVHYRGSSTINYEKKSFSVDLVDGDGSERDAIFFSNRKTDKWILDGMVLDYSRMRNRLCFNLYNRIASMRDDKMIRNGTKGEYVELILNGSYHGLYCLSDKVNRSLLSLKKAKNGIINGILYKCTTNTDSSAYLIRPESEVDVSSIFVYSWELKYPDELPCEESWAPLLDLMDYITTNLNDPDKMSTNLFGLFHKDNLLTAHTFYYAVMLTDNMMHNNYLSLYNVHADHKFWITPWDLDASFGRDGKGNELFHQRSESMIVANDCQPFRMLFDMEDNNYYKGIHEKWDELKVGALSKASVFSEIDSLQQVISESGSWAREYERWNNSPHPLPLSLSEETLRMKEWYSFNYEWLSNYRLLTDGIEEMKEDKPAQTTIYTLQGIPVSPDQFHRSIPKGIYILNGKKHLIR